MKISYNWLKDYVAMKLPPEKLAQQLTLLGLEVVSSEKKAEEVIFEIEVTANRPDCLNVLGIAREIATAFKQKLKIPSLIQKTKAPSGKFIQILDKEGCPRYIGKIIQGIKVAPSPEAMQKRLKAIGLRPVNNIVDITNYLLMELGQPMHAFDLDKLAGQKIIVRRAKAGEKIITIDGEERKLDPDILIITDAEKPVAIAGIMGGKDTEVTEDTKNILLESAYFNPVIIRRAARKLGLASESSYRFERNVDIPMVALASNRAVNLILELAAGKLTSICDVAVGKSKSAVIKTINLNSEKVSRLLGETITLPQIKTILTGLGLKINSAGKESLKVTIPSFRQDLREEEDLIEEVSRHIGFDQLPSTLPAIKISPVIEQPIRKLLKVACDTLLAVGLNEVISLSLISRDNLKKLNWDGPEPLKIKNPLSQDQEIMQPTLLTGLLSAMRNNLNHNLEEVKIFELGRIYTDEGEVSHLGLGIMAPQGKASLLDLKGALEALFRRLKIENAQFKPKDRDFFAVGKSFVITIDEKEMGILGELSNQVAANLDFKHQNIFLSQLNLEAILKYVNWERRFAPLINFPLVRRDISLIIKEGIPSGQIIALLKQEAGPLLINISLADQYSGEQIPVGHRGLTYCLEFQAPNRTLSDSEVNTIHSRLCDLLTERLTARIRR